MKSNRAVSVATSADVEASTLVGDEGNIPAVKLRLHITQYPPVNRKIVTPPIYFTLQSASDLARDLLEATRQPGTG